jgi:hypothetical protein
MTAAPNLGAALGVRNFIALLTEINTAITLNNFKIEHIPGLEELALCQLGLCELRAALLVISHIEQDRQRGLRRKLHQDHIGLTRQGTVACIHVVEF